MKKIFETFKEKILKEEEEEVNEGVDWKKVADKRLPKISNKLQLQMISHFKIHKTSDGVSNITPTYEEYQEIFGDYMNEDDGGLLKREYPEWFDDKVVETYFSRVSPQCGKKMMFLMLCRDNVYSYMEEKTNFFEHRAWEEAIESGKSYLYMENLS